MMGIDVRAAKSTWTAALVLLGLYAAFLIRETLLVVTISVLFAYLLYPLLDLLDQRLPSKTRTPALLVTYGLVLGLICIFGGFIGTVVVQEATNLTHKAPQFVSQLKQRAESAPNQPRTWKDQVLAAAEDQVQQHYNEVVSAVPTFTLKVLSASTNLIYLVIIPILSFFILKDGRSIRNGFIELFDTHADSVRETLNDVHILLLSYMRAQLFLCLATLVTFSIVFSAIRLPYATLLAAIAFPLEFIPLVGPLTAAVIIVTVSTFSGFAHVGWVIVFLLVFRMFQDYVLSPHLMSSGVELHPVMVILGVIAGGEIGGVAGTFLSVPALALIRLLLHDLRKRQRKARV